MSAGPSRILIIGGYGTFGGRLAQLLADEPRLTLLIAGRSLDRAAAFCAGLPAGAAKVPLEVDRDRELEAQLREIGPDLVVDATGPFQGYGVDPYRVVKACLAMRIAYMDLADGSDFVKGIVAFDEEARRVGVVVLSGVSSFPVLTAAVVRQLSKGALRVEAIRAGIAPSPYAGVGLNVVRAVAGYSGQPLRLVRDGRESIGYGLTESMRYTIAPPGRLPLDNLLFSLVDVPDLQVLPELWPHLRSIWIGAGPVPEILHRALKALAWLVRLKLLPSLSPFAPLFYRAIKVFRWGEHRGGMFVAITVLLPHGRHVERSWHLLAEGNDGPFIPSMAIEALVRASLAGHRAAPGARPATQELELSDYDTVFTGRAIFTGYRDSETRDQPLYRRVLGSAWETLPEPLKALHDLTGQSIVRGIATVERGTGLLSRVAAVLFGFPDAGREVPVSVAFDTKGRGETWRRTFGRRSFSSTQAEGRGRSDRLIVERFGPLAFGLALVLDREKLRIIVRRWSFLGVPLPRTWAPRGDSYERAEGGRFHFHVEIGHPLTGLIVRYRGWLVPQRDLA